MYNNTNEEVSLFEDDDDHCHIIQEKIIGDELKMKIKSLFKSGNTKPKLIMRSLRKDGHNDFKESQLKNYLQVFKNKDYGPAKISLGKII